MFQKKLNLKLNIVFHELKKFQWKKYIIWSVVIKSIQHYYFRFDAKKKLFLYVL